MNVLLPSSWAKKATSKKHAANRKIVPGQTCPTFAADRAFPSYFEVEKACSLISSPPCLQGAMYN
jgi:hypothetical protein